MYLEFFKLNQLPFRLSPDPQFMYLSTGHSRALACMKSALAREGGCSIITGKHGVGKTLLLESLLGDEPRSVGVARINHPPSSVTELIEVILKQLDSAPSSITAREPQDQLNEVLAEAVASNRHVVLMVDDAHLLGEDVLSVILRGTLAASAGSAALRILIMGQPALADALAASSFAGRTDQLGERFHLPPLAMRDVCLYIEHRLAIAGAKGPRIFHEETFSEIFHQTGGTPRLMNALCDAAMVVACERQLRQVRLSEVQHALEDMGWMVRARRDDVMASRQSAASSRVPQIAPEPAIATRRGVVARLTVMHNGKSVMERELMRGRLRVGRDPNNELQIDSQFISRHHCQVLTTDEMSLIEDVRSTNGLYVNDRRVRRHRLQHGDVVLVGEHELHYVDLRVQAPTAV